MNQQLAKQLCGMPWGGRVALLAEWDANRACPDRQRLRAAWKSLDAERMGLASQRQRIAAWILDKRKKEVGGGGV